MSERRPVRKIGEGQVLIAPLLGWEPEEVGGYLVLAQRKDDPHRLGYATSAETAVDTVAFLRQCADDIEARS